ncbi:hypothetical protein [Diaphorobacter caeni]|uniref:hypothetical protein n=1 Tax=Diaphorobacter caeni TaxID=2784387 RepID=UPI00188F1064|nr:hypothetical protein [Diaphorobacter caeni]MBF5006167.1 hypothetical protein [Diaphorobacter caeni]
MARSGCFCIACSGSHGSDVIAEANRIFALVVADSDEVATFDVSASIIQPDWIFSAEPAVAVPQISQVLEWLSQQDSQKVDTVLWVTSGLPLTQSVRQWVVISTAIGLSAHDVHT